MNAKRLFPELTVDIQWAYRKHSKRTTNLFERDVKLVSDPYDFNHMTTAEAAKHELPIVCSLYGHCVAYVG
jgi:hypothetical protein